jgi:hypothetical protein
MKQKVGMVLCVLLGAALVMMCDSDAVQDMLDGEEAAAATDGEEAPAATTSELAGITCPAGGALVVNYGPMGTVAALLATCWDVTTKRLNGPMASRCGNGQPMGEGQYFDGEAHGLSISWGLACDGVFGGGTCVNKGSIVWHCRAQSEDSNFEPDYPVYECSTREEAEALAAEHGCP